MDAGLSPIPAPARSDISLERLQALGRLLDDAFEIPGTRFRIGWDAILGLIPGVGDVITAALSIYIIAAAARLGVGRVTLARMIANVGVDMVVGAVPLAGDVFDAAWKANRKNLRLLEKAMAKQGRGRPPAPPR